MKNRILIFTTLLFASQIFAQAPEKMSYQAVIRNTANTLVTNTAVGIKISILQGTSSGAAVYVETQTATTNVNGLLSIEIGAGVNISGNFATINWAAGPYFIKTETDPLGATNYTITGVSQLMSVPYALYAKSSGSSTPGPKGDKGDAGGVGPFYLGKDTLGGIVYYIYTGSDGKQHGLIVSKTQSVKLWQSTGTTTGATRSWDGAFNTALMTNSPAATYVTGLGSGWYLPSVDELIILFQARFHANKALNAGGATLLIKSGSYWSSTEISSTYAFLVGFDDGSASNNTKDGSTIWARGIKSF